MPTFSKLEDVFYGSNDGRFHETEVYFQPIVTHRKKSIHLTSVSGGLAVLNYIALFAPKEITIFDINRSQKSIEI